MTETKPFYKSKSIQGGAVALIAWLFAFVGLDVDKASVTQLVEHVSMLVGIVYMIYGRWVAKERIGSEGGGRSGGMKSSAFFALVMALMLPACASTDNLMDSDASVSIEYENLPVHENDSDKPTGYESYVSRCDAGMRTPAKNEKITLKMTLKDDCEDVTLQTEAVVSDPTHAQTVAGDIEKKRAEEIREGVGDITDAVVNSIRPGFAP